MSPEQSRAARGWLGWSQRELAKRANVSLSTVHDFEAGSRSPVVNNLAAMRDAIETAGIELLFDRQTPVGLRRATLIGRLEAELGRDDELGREPDRKTDRTRTILSMMIMLLEEFPQEFARAYREMDENIIPDWVRGDDDT